MTRIKGVSVTLIESSLVGQNPLGEPIYEESEITVENVLIAPMISEDIINQLNLTGRKAEYVLGIPKGDTHEWENKEVRFFGERWKVFGKPLQGLDHLIPLEWNKKVTVERYD